MIQTFTGVQIKVDMKIKFFQIFKFLGLSALYVSIAMVILILLDADVFDRHDGQLWKTVCAEQIVLQADHDQAVYENSRRELFDTLSPEGDKRVIKYEMYYRDNLFPYDYSYLHGKNFLAVQKTDVGQESEQYLYVGQEDIRDPQWLGNNHILFTNSCGTNCETIYLLDVNTKELLVGTISSVIDTSYKQWQTIFQDWYGVEYTFNGSANVIRSENTNGEALLIFEFGDGWGGEVKKVQFLFTGDSLILGS